jgi:DNA-binding CsgD family transcriptional regulator
MNTPRPEGYNSKASGALVCCRCGSVDVINLRPREIQILACLMRGDSDGQISVALGIARKTVEQYCGRLYRVLDVHSRHAAALWAEKHPGIFRAVTDGMVYRPIAATQTAAPDQPPPQP